MIIYELFIDEKIQLCVSDELLSEYYEVLSRKKFAKFQDFFIRAERLLADIESKSSKYFPIIKLELISDNDDNMILELADECLADFVITQHNRFYVPDLQTNKDCNAQRILGKLSTKVRMH